ncbi:Uncharacterised protein [Mycobacterium tuberculosis]|nr:Uncharacterised protein [Mycobacterium tuberculosis]
MTSDLASPRLLEMSISRILSSTSKARCLATSSGQSSAKVTTVPPPDI